MHYLKLGFFLDFDDLYTTNGLQKLDQLFLEDLKEVNFELCNQLVDLRNNSSGLNDKDYSCFIILLAPYLEDFLIKLFKIDDEAQKLSKSHYQFVTIYGFKRNFIQRQALKACTKEQAINLEGEKLCLQLEELFGEKFSEETYIKNVEKWLECEEKDKLELAALYACWAIFSKNGQKKHSSSIIFKIPYKIDFENLIPIITDNTLIPATIQIPKTHLRDREGFNLNDPGINQSYALDQAHYCIYCHNQGKDSCSKGLKNKNDHSFQKNPLDNILIGCPLEEKISEMNYLKSKGNILGALATIIIDNPMVAATGHRICNDCTKACIYQKQVPVNIPQVETSVLRDILALPWGFEIYSLLTRWNPLKLDNYLPRQDSSYKILVVGLGPAGFTMAHYLLNEGHTVIAIDGLKIEPINPEISGITNFGSRVPFKPIYNVNELYDSLESRTPAGFGGVAEYGITIRWDKNNLKIIRLLLERRNNFRMFGGVRFGSNLNDLQAFKLGFDHIALATGAGRPNIIPFKSGLNKGVKLASDFLMNLQLSGAARESSIANLQIRLPIIIIGGGLTATDSATESLAYYAVQVEKFLTRYETLTAKYGEKHVRDSWREEDKLIADEFINHARAIRIEKAKQHPDILSLLNSWGGVTIVYRNSLNNSPSYRINHEEITYALEEGVKFIEHLTPEDIEIDQFGACIALITKNSADQQIKLLARTVLISTGTSPNIMAAQEMPNSFKLAGKYLQARDINGQEVNVEFIAKPAQTHILTYLNEENKGISFLGDLHPSFAGNVVKAMASAKHGYKIVTSILNNSTPAINDCATKFLEKLNNLLLAKIRKVTTLTENIVEIIVEAPLAARNFQPGQFYRFQNYEYFAKNVNNTVLAMESIALTGANVNKEEGLISLITLTNGGSSTLCTYLKPNEQVVLMGPTGTPTEIPHNETILLVGGGLGNAVLFSIGQACRKNNSRVLYFAGYKKFNDRYKINEIEAAADQVVWCCDEGNFEDYRETDIVFHGNIVEGMVAYAKAQFTNSIIKFSEIDRIITIGSDQMMFAVQSARKTSLSDYLKPDHIAIASINSPMQCMMKEICAQCLQKHIEPITKKETYVYSCTNQDQNMDYVDFSYLSNKLSQNSVQEKLTTLWIKDCIRQL